MLFLRNEGWMVQWMVHLACNEEVANSIPAPAASQWDRMHSPVTLAKLYGLKYLAKEDSSISFLKVGNEDPKFLWFLLF